MKLNPDQISNPPTRALVRRGLSRSARSAAGLTKDFIMKSSKHFSILAVAMFLLVTGYSYASTLSPAATEVQRLVQSGVDESVVLSFIAQSQSFYNLSAADVAALQRDGVSSQAVTAMLNHDGSLHAQQSTASAIAPGAAPSPTTVASPLTTNWTAASGAVSGSATPTSDPSVVTVAPTPAPAPQIEVIPVSPGPDYIWAPGYWSWGGHAWIWIGGGWHHPVRPGRVWVDGYWGGHGRSRAWVGGHWR